MVLILPPTVVASLAASGRLPQLPADVEALRYRGTPRDPLPAELAEVRWVAEVSCCPPGPDRYLGILGFRDVLDHHSMTDVFEVVHLAGSARSVKTLVDWLKERAWQCDYAIAGRIGCANKPMARALMKMSFEPETVGFVWRPKVGL